MKKIHRFFLKSLSSDYCKSDFDIIDTDLLHQWYHVLRFDIGQEIILFTENSDDYVFKILQINKKFCRLSFVNKINKSSDNHKINNANVVNNIYIHIPIIKKDNMYFLLEKCTELGILNFCPIVSERTEKKNIESFKKDIEKGRIISLFKESIEQSHNNKLPAISDILSLKDSIDILLNKDNNVIFVADFGGQHLRDVLTLNKDIYKDKQIHIFIGPEGGWSDTEIQMFKDLESNSDQHFDQHFFRMSLTNSVLRAETATIYCLSFFI